MQVGNTVRVLSCDGCPGVVNKTGVVRKLSEDGTSVSVSFGKGRPAKGRPEMFPVSTLEEVAAVETAAGS